MKVNDRGRACNGRRVMGVVASVVLLAVAGCGSDDTSDPVSGGTSSGEAAVQSDRVLRVIGYSPPAHLDPVRGTTNCELTHLRMIYDSLIRLDQDGNAAPGLAESWDEVDDRTFELTLREGVTFQDGTPFDAEAVQAHLERGKTDPESTMTGVLEVVDSIEAVDVRTVRLHLAEPRAGTLPTILSERAGMVPSPTAVDQAAAGGDEYGTTSAVGAGPYAFESLVPNQLLEVRTWGDDDYWDAAHRLVAGIDFHPVDDTLGIGRVRSGEIDYIATKDSNLPQVEDDSSVQHVLSPTNTFTQLFVNYAEPPFDKLEVRQALNHAIDRELLVEQLTGGAATVAWGPLNAESRAHDDGVEDMYPYNPERARDLLAEAGYPDGISFTAAMIEHPYYTRLAEALQDMLKESSIEVKLESVTGAEINNALYQRKEFSAAITAYAGSSDPALTLEAKYTTYGNNNPSGATVDGLEDLLAEGARTLDADTRAASYRDADRLVMENALEVPIFFLGGLSVFNDDVEGIERGAETCAIGNFLDPGVSFAAS